VSSVSWGQYLDFAEPERLPSAVNTDDEEIMPFLSPDGRTLFFSRVLHAGNIGGKFSGSDIWTSFNDQGIWRKVTNTQYQLNNKDNNAVIGISKDGRTIYHMRSSSGKRLNGIYASKQQLKGSWASPELIPISGLDNHGFSSFYVSPDFDVMFVSMQGKDTRGLEDIYVIVKNSAGEWSKPKNLGPTINTSGFEMSPFLSEDKRYLYFSSNGHQGFGDADIYVSERLYNSWETWSIPRNLGKTINSTAFDAYFTVYGDTISYFASNRSSKLSNIYKANIASSTFSLTTGQRYLEDAEIQELIGKGVSTDIIFEPGVSKLSSPQEELLFFISKRALKNEKVSVLFISDKNELGTRRLSSLVNNFIANGFDASRLYASELKRTSKEKDFENVVRIQFIISQ
jgi:hypothetical protein